MEGWTGLVLPIKLHNEVSFSKISTNSLCLIRCLDLDIWHFLYTCIIITGTCILYLI